MYYEEKLIDGRLMCRTKPGGEWRPVISDVATAVNLLAHLTDDERVSVFSNFCTYCGTTQLPCCCWNDE